MLVDEVKSGTFQEVVDQYGTDRLYIFINDEHINVEDIEEICSDIFDTSQEAYDTLMELAKQGKITIRITRPASPKVATENRITSNHPLKIWHPSNPVLYYSRDEENAAVIVKIWPEKQTEHSV
jgi:hypothetical protein